MLEISNPCNQRRIQEGWGGGTCGLNPYPLLWISKIYGFQGVLGPKSPMGVSQPMKRNNCAAPPWTYSICNKNTSFKKI